MDVVYVLGHDTEELRYSLRSLRNFEHGTVWIVGVKPKWLRNVEHIRVRQDRSKFENSTANIQAACEHPDVSDTFAYFNDDFMAVTPGAEVPNWHMGPMVVPKGMDLARARSGSSYRNGRLATYNMLRRWGHDQRLNYELHVPMAFQKQAMLDVLARAERDHKIVALHKRSLYGNVMQVGGVEVRDPKVGNHKDTWRDGQPWVSTSNKTFDRGAVGVRLRKEFPDPCEYEEH